MSQSQTVPAHIQIIQMGTGYWVSRLVGAAASLGLADHLANGPRSAADLAGPTGTNPRALHRLMRSLAGFGILSQDGGDKFALTELGDALRSDAPGSARSTILAMSGTWMWKAFGEFQYSLETGKTAMEKVFGMPLFDYLAQHPKESAQFSEAMVGIHGPAWVTHPDYALWTLVVLAIWQFGSPMIIFLAGLRQIPQDLYEAASMDGASWWRQFRKITLPLLAPVIFFNLVLQTIEGFKAFTQAFIVSGGTGGPIDSTLFYSLYLYEEAFANFRMGYASALAWILLVIIAIFTAIAFGTSKYWVYYEDESR